MSALAVYLFAGCFAAWSYNQDRWWQRALMVPGWPALFGYGLTLDLLDWWRRHGYRYDRSDEYGPADDNETPPLGLGRPDEWEWP